MIARLYGEVDDHESKNVMLADGFAYFDVTQAVRLSHCFSDVLLVTALPWSHLVCFAEAFA